MDKIVYSTCGDIKCTNCYYTNTEVYNECVNYGKDDDPLEYFDYDDDPMWWFHYDYGERS